MCAERSVGAHERCHDEAAVNGNGLQHTRERPGKDVGTPGSARSGGVVDNFCYLCKLQHQLWSIGIIFFRRIGCAR